jgi:hypothetical protein
MVTMVSMNEKAHIDSYVSLKSYCTT